MGRTACKEPQCLYKVALYLLPVYAYVPQARYVNCPRNIKLGRLRRLQECLRMLGVVSCSTQLGLSSAGFVTLYSGVPVLFVTSQLQEIQCRKLT